MHLILRSFQIDHYGGNSPLFQPGKTIRVLDGDHPLNITFAVTLLQLLRRGRSRGKGEKRLRKTFRRRNANRGKHSEQFISIAGKHPRTADKNPLQARRFGFPDNADAAPGNHAQNPLLLKHPQSNAYSSAPHFQFFRQTALRRQEFRMVVTAGQNPAAESCNDFPVQWSGHLFVVPFQIW